MSKSVCYNADLLIEVAQTLGYCAIRCIPGYWEAGPDNPSYLWIREEKYRLMLVRELIEGCREGGGFVLSACNVIFKGIPAENYQAMVDARRKYGRLCG